MNMLVDTSTMKGLSEWNPVTARLSDTPYLNERGLPAFRVWQETLERVRSMRFLPQNWDYYGATRIPLETVSFTIQILGELYHPDLPAPDASPLSNEGILLEWLSGNAELSLEIRAPYRIQYYLETAMLSEPEEDYICGDDLRLLFELVDRYRNETRINT